jgi:DNA primase
VLLVTEGIPDALTAAEAGYAAVGILGSQSPDDRVADALARHAASTGRQLIAVVDADPAGRAWGEHLMDLVATRGSRLKSLEPPDGLDLNSWAASATSWIDHVRRELDLSCSPIGLEPSSG